MPDKGRVLAYLLLAVFFSMGIGTAPIVCFSLLLLLVWLLSGMWLRTPEWWLSQPWLLPCLLMALLAPVGLIWTMAPDPQIYQLVQRSHYWLFAGVAASTTSIKPKRLCLALIAGVQPKVILLILTNVGLAPVLGVTDALLWRGYLNFSLLLVLAMVLLSFLFRLEPDRRLRAGIVVLMVLDFVALAMLKGRGGYLAFVLLAPVIFHNLVGKRHRLMAIAGALLVTAALLLSPIVRERLQLIVTETQQFSRGDLTGAANTSIGLRLIFWQGALSILKEHPLIGVGTGGYQQAMKKRFPEETVHFVHPHNHYLHIATQFGLLGLTVFAWLCWVTVRRAWPYRTRWGGFAVLAVLAVLAIGSLTDATLQAPQTGILLAIMVGLPLETDECAS